MKRKGLWFTGAGIVLGISVLAHLPAQLVFPEQAGKLRFLGISGSVWRGEIKQILHSGKPLPVRDLNWAVRPAALLTGELKADLYEQQTPTNRGTLDLQLWSREFRAHNLHWQLPDGSLDPWFRAGVSLKGEFKLDLQTLRLAQEQTFPAEIEAQLDWQNAALQMGSEYWQIGSPLMQFSGGGDAINGVVTNSQPTLPGDSTFQCTTSSCRVELNLRPTRDAPQTLLNGLLLMGLQQTGGAYAGQLTLPLDKL
jgi:hypothetical protein